MDYTNLSELSSSLSYHIQASVIIKYIQFELSSQAGFAKLKLELQIDRLVELYFEPENTMLLWPRF